jgi:hypothetical protein
MGKREGRHHISVTQILGIIIPKAAVALHMLRGHATEKQAATTWFNCCKNNTLENANLVSPMVSQGPTPSISFFQFFFMRGISNEPVFRLAACNGKVVRRLG